MDNITEIAFQLISKSGEAKSNAFEALYIAQEGAYDEAKQKLETADELLNEAHKLQFDLLQMEARGEQKLNVNFIMVHAQDHLMTSILAKDLIIEQIKLIQKVQKLEASLNK